MRTKAQSGMLGTIHGELRFLFAFIAVVGIAWTVIGLIRNRAFSPLDQRLALSYSVLLDLQALFGIGLLLYLTFGKLDLRGALNWVGWHPVWMLGAVFVGHMGARWRGAPAQTRFRAQLAVYLISLALIAIGVLASPLMGWV
jgi:hypothetical protein